MLKIIVENEEIKRTLLDESEYIHDFLLISGAFKNNILELNPDKTNLLTHIYKNPDLIEVNKELCKN